MLAQHDSFDLPASAGRDERYMILRAVERVDPVALYGKPWRDLKLKEQIELLAFSDIRQREDARSLGLGGF